jgi:hypothetical protein
LQQYPEVGIVVLDGRGRWMLNDSDSYSWAPDLADCRELDGAL